MIKAILFLIAMSTQFALAQSFDAQDDLEQERSLYVTIVNIRQMGYSDEELRNILAKSSYEGSVLASAKSDSSAAIAHAMEVLKMRNQAGGHIQVKQQIFALCESKYSGLKTAIDGFSKNNFLDGSLAVSNVPVDPSNFKKCLRVGYELSQLEVAANDPRGPQLEKAIKASYDAINARDQHMDTMRRVVTELRDDAAGWMNTDAAR